MFEIEKNVPVKKSTPVKTKYPIEKMDVGDSFLIGKEHLDSMKSWNYEYQCMLRLAAINRMKISTKKQPCGGVRVWRIA